MGGRRQTLSIGEKRCEHVVGCLSKEGKKGYHKGKHRKYQRTAAQGEGEGYSLEAKAAKRT